MQVKKVRNLVADSGAFILNCPLQVNFNLHAFYKCNFFIMQDYGENIFTINDVVNEIKDINTRNSLQVLPYELKYRQPTEEDIKYVGYFAKKTGDFNQLSITDIRLIALVVRLEKEINKGVNLKESPDIQVLPTKSSNNSLTIKDLEFFGYDIKNNLPNFESKNEVESNQETGNEIIENEIKNEIVIDEEDGWITTDNFEKVRDKFLGLELDDYDENENDSNDEISVACITSDFAMQNVLMQMGLNVISPKDGLKIKHTRQYVLRCYACKRINPPKATLFCKHCGNRGTLKRVSITINQDGTVKMHINFKRPIRVRGTRYSLPMPRGGKHANNPILCEDQRIPQQRKSKQAIEEKKLLNMQTILTDPDYALRSNPFAINDVYSRSSRLMPKQQSIYYQQKKPTGNKKKKGKIN